MSMPAFRQLGSQHGIRPNKGSHRLIRFSPSGLEPRVNRRAVATALPRMSRPSLVGLGPVEGGAPTGNLENSIPHLGMGSLTSYRAAFEGLGMCRLGSDTSVERIVISSMKSTHRASLQSVDRDSTQPLNPMGPCISMGYEALDRD